MNETWKAFSAWILASGAVVAASEVQAAGIAPTPSDPIVVIGSLAGGVLALLTLVVKDRLSPQPVSVNGKDLMDRLEGLVTNTDNDRKDRLQWQGLMLGRMDTLDSRMQAVEIGQESLKSSIEIVADECTLASWRSNQSGHCVWASRTLQEMVGYSFREGFEGTNWIEVFPRDEADHVRERWEDSVKTGTNFSLRTKYRHKDGTVFPVQLNASVLADGTWRGTAKRI